MKVDWVHDKSRLLSTAILLLILAQACWAGSDYSVLHAFTGKPDGGGLWARLALDAQGNAYGTTTGGGVYGLGTVFQLAPGKNRWTETIIHDFCPDWPTCSDGDLPFQGVTIDEVGNAFGTTGYTTYELSPNPGGWTFQVILNTATLLITGNGGSLFAESGPGACNGGDIIKLKPPPGGGYWIPKDIYDFCLHDDKWSKGNSPNYGLSWDNAGNLYGVTDDGGRNGYGVVFQLEHTPHGWKEHVLHSFRLDGQDGFFPQAGVVVDAAGTVYGSTMQGGSERCGGPGCGTIYKLAKQPDGHWKETILYRFPNTDDGGAPVGTLAMDSAGNLYGVAGGGGNACSCGVVYKFLHNPDDTWTYTVLHRFKGTDGARPVAGVILDAKATSTVRLPLAARAVTAWCSKLRSNSFPVKTSHRTTYEVNAHSPMRYDVRRAQPFENRERLRRAASDSPAISEHYLAPSAPSANYVINYTGPLGNPADDVVDSD